MFGRLYSDFSVSPLSSLEGDVSALNLFYNGLSRRRQASELLPASGSLSPFYVPSELCQIIERFVTFGRKKKVADCGAVLRRNLTLSGTRLPKRISKEIQRILRRFPKEMNGTLDIQIDEGNYRHFRVVIDACDEWLYFPNAHIEFELFLPKEYPMKPPKVLMKQPVVYHPAVDSVGRVCSAYLTSHWTPALNIERVAQILLGFLSESIEGIDYNLNCDAMICANNDMAEFVRRAHASVAHF